MEISDIGPTVNKNAIPLKNPPFDIAVNPNTNKVYVTHQSPPSVSVIDGN